MKKSTLIMILSLVLAVALGVGSTMAYLLDTDEDVNVMTLGSVYITQNEQEYNEDGELVPFTQDKPMFPAVGTPAWNLTDESTEADKAWRQFAGMENVVDKYVTVTNTGKSDAYVRTLVALEMGELDINAFADVFGLSANIVNGDEFKFPGTWKIFNDAVYTINGKTYNVMTFEHQNALVPGETTIPSILQMYLKGEATTNETMEKIDGNGNGKYDVLVLSQAVQTQGFADATTALNTAFGEINQDNVQEWFANIGKNIGSPGDKWPNNNPPLEVDGHAANKGEMKTIIEAALAEGQTEIVVDAKGEEFLNLYYALNGKLVPEGVTLYLNNAKITENCYGNGVNGTVIFNNCTFENAGGPYSIHFDSGKGNVIFNDCTLKGWCSFGSAIKNVEMNNCTIEGNGIYAIVRFYQNAKLTNCTIDCGNTNTDDVYTDGVSSVGGTVELVNCTVKNAQYEVDDGCTILVDGVEPEYI